MIDFRYHIVSIVAVFLALALGLFLGSTSLQSTVTHNLKGQANKVLGDNHRLSAANHQLTGSNRALTNFTAAVEPYAVAGQLSGSTVALLSAPGVNGSIRKNLTTTLTEAGASVIADVGLSSTFLDSTQDAELGQLARELESTRPLPRQNGAIQAGYVLAHTLLARPGTLAATRGRLASVLSTFSAGRMLSVAGRPPVHPAEYAVLIVPAGAATDATPSTTPSQDNVLITLAKQLRAAASGVVMAGPTIDPGFTGGTLDVARADPTLPKSISTVDAIDSPAGRIATVIALASASGGQVGAYGLAPHDAPVLSPSPTP